MTRLDAVRARVNATSHYDTPLPAERDRAFLLDLVERAVLLVEVLYDQTGYQRLQAGQWLRDVGSGSNDEGV